jgi:hypothetical protein
MGSSSYVSVVAGLTICVVMLLRIATWQLVRRVQWAKASALFFSRHR